MEEVELGCAVYGEGTVFPVKIARDAKVSALQEKIFEKKRYSERYKFSASDLTLYLAKKNGAWLKDDDNVEEVLQGEIDTAYKKMRPMWKLNEPEYFGDFQLGEETIHVLVELPKCENRAIVVVPDADDGDEVTSSDYKPFYLSLLQYFVPPSRSLEKIQKTKKDV